jgi:hypothetical protein
MDGTPCARTQECRWKLKVRMECSPRPSFWDGQLKRTAVACVANRPARQIAALKRGASKKGIHGLEERETMEKQCDVIALGA